MELQPLQPTFRYRPPDETNGIQTATENTIDLHSQRHLDDYQHYMAELIEWMLTLGKTPEKVEGYSRDTTRLTIYKPDKYHRWVWNNVTDGYTLQLEHSHADDYMYELATSDEFKQRTGITDPDSFVQLRERQGRIQVRGYPSERS